MALVSNIIIDLGNTTASLTVTKASIVVETISFASNMITFASRPTINLTAVEFADLISQVNIFQTALSFNFQVNISQATAFNSTNCTEAHDVPGNKWNLVVLDGATPRVVNYSADGSNNTVDLINRSNPKTIEILEWVYLLFNLNHYNSSVARFFA